MKDKESFSSRSSLPQLLREEDDETDEILIFDEDALEVEEDYEFGAGFDDDLRSGYSFSELEHKVTFVRSSKNPKTGDFERERKSLLWCIENGYEEAQPGVWSGFWYFTYLFGEAEGKRAWVEAMNKRLVMEGGGRAMQLDPDDFRAMLHQKEKGKRAFARGQYKGALDCFVQAENLMGGDVSGIYLVPHQRAEMVVLLSNQAECYLRLKKYEEAALQTTKALQLDKRHNKSLLRRAKAIMHGSEFLLSSPSLNSILMNTSAAEDLQTIIGLKGDGMQEAQSLLATIRPVGVARSLPSQQ